MHRLATYGKSAHKNSLIDALKQVRARANNSLRATCFSTFCRLAVSDLLRLRASDSSARSFRSAAALQPKREHNFSTRQFLSVAPARALCSPVSLRSFTSAAMHDPVSHQSEAVSRKEASLIQLFLAASLHLWEQLPGYAPALSATKHLYNAQRLPEDVPGKSGGPPGNAFELVYAKVTDAVRRTVRKVDPVLADWIRVHLYGDVYSSPGLSMQHKQLLMVAFLGQANMPDELGGHALAAMRFGVSPEACKQAMQLGFKASLSRLSSTAQSDAQDIQEHAEATLQKAVQKYQSGQFAENGHEPEVTIPDPASVSLPPLPPRHISPGRQ